MSSDKLSDLYEDAVDPRVQIELERLNTATNEINKLEVDLDEARNRFRSVLAESTQKINTCAKKLGNCIDRARPYYESRLKTKQALQETQKAAIRFEKANSAHAAAKEMVFLAEEGLQTEGTTFDHAWQEMLNHATMRVNESEAERTAAEAEHRRTSQQYQNAELRVCTLQKELKRAIAKSSLRIRRNFMLMSSISCQHEFVFLPYFELKIHYNQLLEQQKNKVKDLEKQVSQVKASYAETLRNLEHISDEIHKTRQNLSDNSKNRSDGSLFVETAAVETNNDIHLVVSQSLGDGKSQLIVDGANKLLTPISESSCTKLTPNTPGSSQPDTDFWSESSGPGQETVNDDGDSFGSALTENDSSVTGPPDSESDDEFFKLPNKLCQSVSPTVHKENEFVSPSTEYKGIVSLTNEKYNLKKEIMGQINQCLPLSNFKTERFHDSFYVEERTDVASFPDTQESSNIGNRSDNNWTEIKLNSPNEQSNPFLTMKKVGIREKVAVEEEFDIPYAPLSEVDGDFTVSVNPLANWEDNNEIFENIENQIDNRSKEITVPWLKKTLVNKTTESPSKTTNSRRQSLDILWNNTTGEKVKEIISHGISKLSIGALSERRSSDVKSLDDDKTSEIPSSSEPHIQNEDNGYESNLSSQFGLQFFTKRLKPEDESYPPNNGVQQETFTNQIGGFISRKERFFSKKVPSPLDRSINYLNTDEESGSDCESLTSLDMISDDQLASLVLDQDLSQVYYDIL